MWEHFRHTRLHDALRNINPISRSVRFVKKRSSQFMRRWNLRTGRGLHKLIALDTGHDSIAGLVDFRVLFPAQDIIITPDRKPLFEHQKIVSYQNDRVHAHAIVQAVFESATVDMHTGTLVSADNTIIAKHADMIPRMKNNSTYGAVPRARPTFMKGTCAVIHGFAYGNYYHWLIEALPTLYSLKLLDEPVQILVPDTLKPRYRHMLELCVPPNVNIVTTSLYMDRWIQAERMVYGSQVTALHTPTLRAEHIDYLRSSFFTGLNLPDSHEKKHNIFITRRHGQHRQILNGDAVQQTVERFGFRPYILEDMSFEEQVRLFHSANVVVAAHGAGLTNLIFSGQIHVVEVNSITATPTFALLTQLLNQKYQYLLPLETTSHSVLPDKNDYSTHFQLNNKPISVDLHKLEAILERIMNVG